VGMVDAWAADVDAGHDTVMLAFQRVNVADLNQLGRAKARELGWLDGPDLPTPDGRLFAAGDEIVTLAPNRDHQLVTSERGTVIAVQPRHQTMVIRTEDGHDHVLRGAELDADRIAHGYAITVHREQGGTVDVAHRYNDGGGGELAYVALSRARYRTQIHGVADDLDQAVEDFTREWTPRADQWVSRQAAPGIDPLHANTEARRGPTPVPDRPSAVDPPPDYAGLFLAAQQDLGRLRALRDHLTRGTGPYEHTEAGRAARHLHQLEADLAAGRHHLAQARRWQRPSRRRHLEATGDAHAASVRAWNQIGQPEVEGIDDRIAETEARIDELTEQVPVRERTWRNGRPLTSGELTRQGLVADLIDDLDERAPDGNDGLGRQLDGHTRVDRPRPHSDARPPERDDGLGI
jgi:hypothetical protein